MEHDARTTGENMRTVARWRARSALELIRLRILLDEAKPLAVYCTSNETVVVMPDTADTVHHVVLPVEGFPCIAAHVSHYGDNELMSLLHGHMRAENLPKYLHNVPMPQAWFEFMLSFAELSAPGERPAYAPVPSWVMDEAVARDL